jgi:hypothetical protein
VTHRNKSDSRVGGQLTSFFGRSFVGRLLTKRREARILMVGLDASGTNQPTNQSSTHTHTSRTTAN